jgi:hypothetical protein
MANGLKSRVFPQSFKKPLVGKVYPFYRGLESVATEFYIFRKTLLKFRQTILLLQVVNFVAELLILGFSMSKRRIVQIAMHTPPVTQLLCLSLGWIKTKCDATVYTHR